MPDMLNYECGCQLGHTDAETTLCAGAAQLSARLVAARQTALAIVREGGEEKAQPAWRHVRDVWREIDAHYGD